MGRPLFLRIVNGVEQYDPYFVQTTDAIGNLGLSSLQKVTVAFRILTYGTPADSVDEYMRIGESTAIDSLRRFVQAVIVQAMHNMIIEDEGATNDNDFDGSGENPIVQVSHVHTPEFVDFIQTHHQIRSNASHSQLQYDLIEHLWQRYGQ